VGGLVYRTSHSTLPGIAGFRSTRQSAGGGPSPRVGFPPALSLAGPPAVPPDVGGPLPAPLRFQRPIGFDPNAYTASGECLGAGSMNANQRTVTVEPDTRICSTWGRGSDA
jgi:hypothetical protein